MSVPLVSQCLQTMSVVLLLFFATEWSRADELVDFQARPTASIEQANA